MAQDVLPFPKELYDLVPALYPHVADILRRTGISGPEFLSLSFVKNRGKQIEDGVVGLPLAELKALLIAVGEYETDGGASGFITGTLENKHRYLKPGRLTPEQKELLFPDSPGYRDVVIITDAGFAKLADINAGIERLFGEVTSHVTGFTSRAALRTFLKAFGQVAGAVINRLEGLRINESVTKSSD